MNKDYKSLDQKFMQLTDADWVEVDGGWVGGRIRSRIGSGSGSSNRGGANNGGGADQGIFN